jgi:hypothetical protein
MLRGKKLPFVMDDGGNYFDILHRLVFVFVIVIV